MRAFSAVEPEGALGHRVGAGDGGPIGAGEFPHAVHEQRGPRD